MIRDWLGHRPNLVGRGSRMFCRVREESTAVRPTDLVRPIDAPSRGSECCSNARFWPENWWLNCSGGARTCRDPGCPRLGTGSGAARPSERVHARLRLHYKAKGSLAPPSEDASTNYLSPITFHFSPGPRAHLTCFSPPAATITPIITNPVTM